MKRSAVVSVKTGWMVLRVGVGFDLIVSEAEAARRRGVDAFGLGGLVSSAKPRVDTRKGVQRRSGLREGVRAATSGLRRRALARIAENIVGDNLEEFCEIRLV